MRDYGVVSPRFWIGSTGKTLRGNAPAQVLALYLMTSPHANMIGVFHCPLIYMAHETGLSMEGASKALQSLIEAKFCTYEESSETVFVHRMAAFQIGDQLSEQDKRCKGVEREWNNIPSAQLRQAFFAIYSGSFHLPKQAKKTRGTEAPSKPLRSQEQDQDQDQDKEEANASSSPADAADSTMLDCPHGKLLDLWAGHCPTLTQPKRSLWPASNGASALRTRWRWVLTATEAGKRMATTEDEALAWFGRFFAYVASCPLLIGEGSRGGWQADLAWCMKAENFAKIMQGNYERRQAVAA